MKLLGIDYGRRRIGIAVTDPTGEFIHGRPTLDRKKCADTLTTLTAVIREESPDALVFGVPLGPRDEETAMSAEVRDFAGRLAQTAQLTMPIHFVDESFSSMHAQKLVRSKKKKHRQKKETTDRIAACCILESFQRQRA